MTDDLRTGLARAIVETGLLDGDEARSAADATIAVFTKHMQSDAMVEIGAQALEMAWEQKGTLPPIIFSDAEARHLARAVLSSIGERDV